MLGDVPGHEFHGNQWVGYHGTTAKNAEKILKEGLKPDKQGDIWTTTNLIEAKTYARAAGDDSVILSVHVSANDKTKYDERKSSKTLRVYKEPLKAEYVSMHSTHVSGGPFGEWKSLGDVEGHPFHGNQWTTASIESKFPSAGKTVDGLTVRDGVPNESSIESSLTHYDVLPGIREVQMSDMDPGYMVKPYSVTESKRLDALERSIRDSKQISPLIVVVDKEKHPYVLEGGHRYDALRRMGVKSFPAKVVIDTESVHGGRP